MFRKRLEALMLEQRERMLQIVEESTVDEAFDFLLEHDLSVDAIDSSLTEELKIILLKKNDVQIEMSNRLNKFGWTSARVLDHMLKVFYAKTQAIGRVLKAFMDSKDPMNALEGYDGPKNVLEVEDSEEVEHEIGKAYKQFASGLDDLDID